MKRIEYSDLVDKIIAAKAPTTQGWDVLCSYDIDKVNAIFAREHNKNKIIPTEKKFSVNKTDDITNIPYSIEYDLKLGNPNINFIAGLNGHCKVNFPIDSTSTWQVVTQDGKTHPANPIPPSYTISMKVPLAQIKGDSGNNTTEKPKDNKDIKTAGEVVILNQNGGKATVVLHFNNSPDLSNSINYEPPITNQHIDDIVTIFKQQVQDIDYNITTVTANPSDSSKANSTSSTQDVTLIPKSFIFTTTTYDNGNNDTGGALHVWIQTGDNEGRNNPEFPIMLDEKIRCFPIPQKSTSSIVFNQNTIKNLYITPNINTSLNDNAKKNNTNDSNNTYVPSMEYTDSKNADGIEVRIKLKEITKNYSYDNSHWYSGTDLLKCDQLKVDFNSNPILFDLLKGTMSLSWNWQQNLNYHAEVNSNFTQDNGKSVTGSISASVALNKTITLNDLNTLTISINKDDVLPKVTHNDDDPQWWELGKFGYDSSKIADDIKSALEGGINLSLSFGSLNYFAEANIIFSESVFTSKGISGCGDLLIIGDIANSSS